jgi:Prokaryotic phospholipase A2
MSTVGRRGRAPRWAGAVAVVAAIVVGLVMANPATRAAASPVSTVASSGARIAGHSLSELLGAAVSGRSPMVVTWREFRGVMGYSPITARLPDAPVVRAIKPDGSCSSVLGGTRFGFSLACKAHDLGYDLLRFAARTGQPAGPQVRRALDAQLGRDLHARCAVAAHGVTRLACDALADLYAAGARLNSWRQGYGTP